MNEIKIYPMIELEYQDRYISINDENREFFVWFYLTTTNKINVTALTTVYTLDENIYIKNNFIYPLSEGTCIVNFIYEYEGVKYTKEIEFVIYNSFFRDNYERHILPNIDRINMQTNVPYKVVFDTLFEFYDILYAYQNDIQNIKNPLKVKNKYLKTLFSERGFQFIDFETENNSLDALTTKVYKNLLNNLIEILDIRGTKTAYELFFGALGYDIEIFEFWFNDKEQLIEINVNDPDSSTFDTYNLNGERLEEEFQEYVDPRNYVNGNNNRNYFNKSNYVRVTYSKNSNLPSQFIKSKTLIKEYLEWLKPNHIEYLTEIFKIDELNDNFYNLNETVISSPIYIFDDDPPYINPEIFISTGKKLILKGSALITQFFSEGIITLNGAAITGNYTFESTNGVINLNGSGFEYKFISTNGFLKLNGDSTATYTIIYDTFDPGPPDRPVIYWQHYLTQANRDNFETGFVKEVHIGGKIFKIPADFFALDYSHINSYKTSITLSRNIYEEDEIKNGVKFDFNWNYDEGIKFDSFSFLQELINNNTIVKFIDSELRNKYSQYVFNNPKLITENDYDYDIRIKNMIINEYKNLADPIVIYIEILNNIL